MPETAVRVFRDARGDAPLLEWLDDLENRDRKGYAKCLDRILQLATLGNELRRPVSDILR